MPLSKETIGRRIANARKASQMTQAELSEKIDISEKYLSRIERGKQLPNIVIVAQLCEVLNISADELLAQSNIYNKAVQNEVGNLSKYEQKQILEIIKIIMNLFRDADYYEYCIIIRIKENNR